MALFFLFVCELFFLFHLGLSFKLLSQAQLFHYALGLWQRTFFWALHFPPFLGPVERCRFLGPTFSMFFGVPDRALILGPYFSSFLWSLFKDLASQAQLVFTFLGLETNTSSQALIFPSSDYSLPPSSILLRYLFHQRWASMSGISLPHPVNILF